MNYKREKLNKTNAIPTIYLSDDLEIDLMESPTDWVAENELQANSEELTTPKNIDMDEQCQMVEYDFQVSDSTADSPPSKKIRIDTQKQPIKILNIEAFPKVNVVQSTPKQTKNVFAATVPSSSSKKPVRLLPVKTEPKGYSIRRVSPKKEYYTQQSVIEEVPLLLIESEAQNAEVEESAGKTDELKTLLFQCMKDNADIKDLIIKQQGAARRESSSSSHVTQPEESSVITQSHLNKVQLFNGIKRYLSPAMVALLRMDLFCGSSSREYKADEKVICKEILQFGNEVYSFLSDEWRLRLPPKETVEKWIREQQDQDEDDAS